MSAFDKGKQWKACIALLNAMESAQENKPTKNKNYDKNWVLPLPNEYTYSAAISACARSGQGKEALQLLNTLKRKHQSSVDKDVTVTDEPLNSLSSIVSGTNLSPNRWVYNAALAACAYSDGTNLTSSGDSRLDMALKILDQMENDSLAGYDTAPDTISFNTALAAIGGIKAVYTDQSGDTICTFVNEGEFSSLNTKSVSFSNEEDMVLDILERMTKNDLVRDSVTYRNAILACRSNTNAAQRILDRALKDDEYLRGIDHKSHLKWKGKIYVINAALSVCASNGDLNSLATLFKTIKDQDLEANKNSMHQVLRALGLSRNSDSLMLVLNAMKGDSVANKMFFEKYGIDIIRSIGNSCPMIYESHYSTAITMALKQGQLFIAVKILHAMNLHGLNPSENSLHAIIFSYSKLAVDTAAKEFKDARKNAIKRKKKQSVLNVDHKVSSTRADAAYTMMKSLKKPSPKLQAAVSIACAAAGMWSEGRRILRSMHHAALLELELENSNEPTLSIQGSGLAELPYLHRSLLKLCARSGNVTAALWYVGDIQYMNSQLRSSSEIMPEKTHLNASEYETTLLSGDVYNSTDYDNNEMLNNTSIIHGVGMDGENWKLLMIAASKSAHWRVCIGTLQFIRPFIEETHPKYAIGNEVITNDEKNVDIKLSRRKKSLGSLNRKYEKLARSLTAAILCFETRSQYGWAVRAIYDWIEWSGRRPRKEAIFAACRSLARRGKGSQVLSMVKMITYLPDDEALLESPKDTQTDDTSIPDYKVSYERAVYTEAIFALYLNGLYDNADELYASAVYDGYLPWPVIDEENNKNMSQLKIDLHGMNRAVAHSAVRVVLQQEIQATSYRLNMTLDDESDDSVLPQLEHDVIIITGKGKRSAQRLRPVLRPEVQRMLIEEFYPPLGTYSIPGNMGALVIPVSDVNAWLKHQKEQKGIRLLAVAGILKNISSGNRIRQLLSLKMNDETKEPNN